MSTKRRVMVSHYTPNLKTNGVELEEKGVATFHGFGLDHVEEKVSYSVAIVEWPNGEVEAVNVELIRFLVSEVPHEQS
jgi:hypothetical protein